MTKYIEEVEAYCADNSLTLGPEKCQLLAVGTEEPVVVQVAGTAVQDTKVIKILGAYLDKKLHWDAQAQSAARKATGVARGIRRCLRGIRRKERGELMIMLAHPYLDYCQTPLALPDARATDKLRRAYLSTAPWAAGTERTHLP